MNFYKYYKINEYSLDAIKNKYFYCSRPSQLNDLFDCRIPIEYKNLNDDELESWISCNGGGNLRGLLPYDFPYDNVKQLKRSFLDGSFEEYFYTKFNEKEMERYHVFSLTTSYNNPVIWGTYNNNEGICIEYESIEYSEKKYLDIFSNTIFGLHVKQLPKTSFYSSSKINDEVYLNLFKVNYISNELQKFNPIIDKYMIAAPYSDLVEYPSITQNLITKNINWNYENEYRAIFATYNNEQFDNKIYYSEEVIKSITFAYNAKKEKIEQVLNAVYEANFNHKIDYYIIKPNYSTKSIERYPITIEELEAINNEK